MQDSQYGVAIVGAEGRFPGCDNVHALWQALCQGRDLVTDFNRQQLLDASVRAALVDSADYVGAAGILNKPEYFDPDNFQISPHDANLMDPQHRQFLSCAWQVLETIGYHRTKQQPRTGVFAGCGLSSYFLLQLYPDLKIGQLLDEWSALFSNDKDSLASTCAYRLNLTGPAVGVQTACSTSLTAVHYAVQSLLSFECDLAIAGGVSIRFPQVNGYLWSEGSRLSRSGRCRTFDQSADGIVPSNGVGCVLLQRLEDAIASGNDILAVIAGTAISNDGANKMSFVAPSAKAQAHCIRAAQRFAGVTPQEVAFVECHGTGTSLGDAVELTALRDVFADSTQPVLLGACKTNTGHLDSAAGVTGLIKTAMVLKHRMVPPTLHYHTANPQLRLEESCFLVNTQPQSLHPTRQLYAGVSSFGVGGTNVHCVLASYPEVNRAAQHHMVRVPLTARSAEALDNCARQIQQVAEQRDLNTVDIAASYGLRNLSHPYRGYLLAERRTLGEWHWVQSAAQVVSDDASAIPRLMLFSGGGSELPGMMSSFSLRLPEFDAQLARLLDESGLEVLDIDLAHGVRYFLTEQNPSADASTSVKLLALLLAEVWFARQWIDAGFVPDVVCGHSAGDYAAAVISGVMSLADATVAMRSRGLLFDRLPDGSMVAVLSEDKTLLVDLARDLSLAAINGPGSFVYSGTCKDIAAFQSRLDEHGIENHLLPINVAAHSKMLDEYLDEFETDIANLSFSSPKIAFISSTTGQIVSDEICHSTYWRNHLRMTVNFSASVGYLQQQYSRLACVEVGPQQILTHLVQASAPTLLSYSYAVFPHRPQANEDVVQFHYAQKAKAWVEGVLPAAVDERGNGVCRYLPVPALAEKRHWYHPRGNAGLAPAPIPTDITEWTYTHEWQVCGQEPSECTTGKALFVLLDQTLPANDVAMLLVDQQQAPEQVYTLCSNDDTQAAWIGQNGSDQVFEIAAWVESLSNVGEAELVIVMTDAEQPPNIDSNKGLSLLSFLFLLMRRFSEQGFESSACATLSLRLLTSGGVQVFADEVVSPWLAACHGLLLSAARECPQLDCRVIDVDPLTSVQAITTAVVYCRRDFYAGPDISLFAVRGGRWFTPGVCAQPLAFAPEPCELWQGSRVLITGGLGGIGLALATHLLKHGASVVLASRRVEASLSHCERQALAHRIADNTGADAQSVLLAAVDLSDLASVQSLQQTIGEPVDGVFHAAGLPPQGMLRDQSLADFRRVFDAKALGLKHLDAVFDLSSLKFVMSFSSTSAWTFDIGAADHCAGCRFIDALSQSRSAGRWVSVNWPAWKEIGQAVEVDLQGVLGQWREMETAQGISVDDGMKIIDALLTPSSSVKRLAVSTVPYDRYLREARKSIDARFSDFSRAGEQTIGADQNLSSAITQVWSDVLGLECVNSDDSFFKLGGHSLLAAVLIRRLNQALNLNIPLRSLFEYPVLRDFCLHIEASTETTQTELMQAEADPVNRYQPFPLTSMQQAFLIGRRADFDLGNIGAHGHIEIRCTDVDIARLEQAVNGLIQRHDMLRAVFYEDGTQRVQQEVAWFAIECIDLQSVGAKQQTEQLAALRAARSHRVFQPDCWPLFSICAARLCAGETLLLLDFDLLLGDGTSIRVLLQELRAFYQSEAEALPAIEFQFRDYVMALEQYKQSAAYQTSFDYWQAKLAQIPSAPALPLRQSTAEVKAPTFKRRKQQLSSDDWQAIKQFAGQHDLTPSAVLLTAFSQVLAYWSEQPNFTINLTLYRRLPFHEQVDGLVGDFTATSLLPVHYQRDAGVVDNAIRLQSELSNTLEHNAVSATELTSDLRRLRDDAGEVLFPVVFTSTLTNGGSVEEGESLSWLGKPVYSISQTPQVWLDHQIFEDEGRLIYYWDCIEELFPESLMETMFAAYTQLLRAIVTGDQDAQQMQLPPTQRSYREQVTQTAYPIPASCLHAGFWQSSEHFAEHIAVSCEGEQMTYAELAGIVYHYSQQIVQQLPDCNRPIGIYCPRGWQTVAAVLACSTMGRTFVPLDVQWPGSLLARVVKQIQPTLIFTVAGIDLPEAVFGDARVIAISKVDQPRLPDLRCLPAVDPHSDAYIIFTSGTTGIPKGVVITHDAASNTIADINRRCQLGPDDAVFAYSNLSFDLSIYDIFGSLSVGAKVVVPGAEELADPKSWAALIEHHQCTLWNSVPSACELLCWVASAASLQSLRFVLLSGDYIPLSLPGRLLQLVPDTKLFSLGGATEAAIWSVYYPVEEVAPHWKSIPYGYPLANQYCTVLNSDLQPCPDWVMGDLYIGGRGLAREYWCNPEITENSFITCPANNTRLYKTGDKARYWPDGTLEFLGRKDSQVKIRGYRVELGDIEEALMADAAVARAVVLAPGERFKERKLVAFILAQSTSQTLDKQAIAQRLSQRLPYYMLPSLLIEIDELPLSHNGKVDRKSLLARQAQYPQTSADTAAASVLLEIWAGLFPDQVVSEESNFFDLGGNSLTAVRMVAALAEKGIHLQVADVFRYETPAALMATALSIQPVALPPGDNVERSGAYPCSSLQHGMLVDTLKDPYRGIYIGQSVFYLQGDLDIEHFRDSWRWLMDRHQVLRSHFDWQSGETPQLVVDAYRALPLTVLTGTAAQGDIAAFLVQDRKQGFSLSQEPMFRLHLRQQGERRWLFVLSMHHAIMDAWSSKVLFEEFLQVYRAMSASQSPLLSIESTAPYSNYLQRLQRMDYLEAEARWRNYLQGYRPARHLLKQVAEPASGAEQAGELNFAVDDACYTRIKRLCQASRATLANFFQMVLGEFICAEQSVKDALYCMTVSGRSAELVGVSKTVGLFINVAPVRYQKCQGDSVEKVLNGLMNDYRQLEAYQCFPLSKVFSWADIDRDTAATDVNLVLEEQADWQQQYDVTDDLQVTAVESNIQSSFAMTLRVVPTCQLRFDVLFDRRFLTEDTALAYGHKLMALIAQSSHGQWPQKIKKFQRRATSLLTLLADPLVQWCEDNGLAVAQAQAGGVNLQSWYQDNQKMLSEKLSQNGGLLLRGFNPLNEQGFGDLATQLMGGVSPYIERSTPRSQVIPAVFTSTHYPADRRISLHNEQSYATDWPQNIAFYCDRPAAKGGATTLASSELVYRRIDPEIRDEFDAKGVMYVRNYGTGLDLQWQDVFQVETRSQLEAYCRDKRIDFQWSGKNRLTTRQHGPGVIRHQNSGKKVWFNQAHLFHVSGLGQQASESLLASYGESGLPRQAFFGDGSDIPEAYLTHVRQILDSCQFSLNWQIGDLVVLDNVLYAHGREPYQGERRVWVSLGKMVNEG